MQGKLNLMAEVIKLFFSLIFIQRKHGVYTCFGEFWLFFTEQVSHFHCNAMRKATKVHTNLHTNQKKVLIHEDKSS